MKCCANCHFGVDGDGDTVHCNWTGNKRMPRDGSCEDYDGEHPDAEYWRKDSEYKDARIAELEAEVERLRGEIRAAFERYGSGIPFDDFRAALAEKEPNC